MRALAADDTLRVLFHEAPDCGSPEEVEAKKDAVVAGCADLAGEDLYRVGVDRDEQGRATRLVTEFLGPLPTLPEEEDDAMET